MRLPFSLSGYNKMRKDKNAKGAKVKGKMTNMLTEKISRSILRSCLFAEK